MMLMSLQVGFCLQRPFELLLVYNIWFFRQLSRQLSYIYIKIVLFFGICCLMKELDKNKAKTSTTGDVISIMFKYAIRSVV